jgi:predicted aspartyl protease
MSYILLLLDTGAEATVLTPAAAQRRHLPANT